MLKTLPKIIFSVRILFYGYISTLGDNALVITGLFIVSAALLLVETYSFFSNRPLKASPELFLLIMSVIFTIHVGGHLLTICEVVLLALQKWNMITMFSLLLVSLLGHSIVEKVKGKTL